MISSMEGLGEYIYLKVSMFDHLTHTLFFKYIFI